jgi:hypothetical protein
MADESNESQTTRRHRRADRHSNDVEKHSTSGGGGRSAAKGPKSSLPALNSYKIKKYNVKNGKSAEGEVGGVAITSMADAAIASYIDSLAIKVRVPSNLHVEPVSLSAIDWPFDLPLFAVVARRSIIIIIGRA